MIKITKGPFGTYTIENGECMPKNKAGGFDKKDLEIIYKKIGKILGEVDWKKEMEKDKKKFICKKP